VSIEAAISSRCPSPEWALFFELQDKTGFGSRRRADAVAMNTWHSRDRGLSLHGFEIKKSRGDWLRELRDPEKSVAVQRYCDRWWLAVANDKIVKDGELPEAWGLLVLRGRVLVQAKEAPKLDPVPVDREFVAALLRAASVRFVDKAVVDAKVEEQLEARLRAEGLRDHRQFEIDRLERLLVEERKKWAEFSAVVGPSMIHDLTSAYRLDSERERLRNAIRFVAAGGLDGQRDEVRTLALRLREMAARLEELEEPAKP